MDMTESERGELLLGARSVEALFKPGDFGPSELKTYAPFLTWTEGPLLAAVQALANKIEEYEATVTAAQAKLVG